MADNNASEERQKTLEAVLSKVKMAGHIAESVLRELLSLCVAGAKILDLCELGDSMIAKETSQVFSEDSGMKKGIAFPTCVSLNNCISNFSPLKSDQDVQLKNGDVVKVQLGAHIDGRNALVAHTTVVGSSRDNVVTGRRADAILAAYYGAEAAARLVKLGVECDAATDTLQSIAEDFHCMTIEEDDESSSSREDSTEEALMDCNEVDISSTEMDSSLTHCVEDLRERKFGLYDTVIFEVQVSSGHGHSLASGFSPTILGWGDAAHLPQSDALKTFMSKLQQKFGDMPFTLRALADDDFVKHGIEECLRRRVLKNFPVRCDTEGEFVAQFMYTIAVLPNGNPEIVCGLPLELSNYWSEYSVRNKNAKKLLSSLTNPWMKKNIMVESEIDKPASQSDYDEAVGREIPLATAVSADQATIEQKPEPPALCET